MNILKHRYHDIGYLGTKIVLLVMKSVPLHTKYDYFITSLFSLQNDLREPINSFFLKYLLCLKHVICYLYEVSYA